MSDEYELDPEEEKFLYGEAIKERHKSMMNLVMINKIRKTRVTVELRDEDNEKVDIGDLLDELSKHITKSAQDTDGSSNQIIDQILPFMSMTTAYLVAEQMPPDIGAMLLSTDTTKYAIIHNMCCSFLLLKVLGNKGLKIFTIEEPLQEGEFEELQSKSKMNEYLVAAKIMGLSLEELIENLQEAGKISKEEAEYLAGSKKNGN